MSLYARIQDGIVEEIISLPDNFNANELFPDSWTVIPTTSNITVRMTWDGSNFGPIPVYIPPPITKITPLQFKARFDTSTWTNILSAAMTDPVVLGWVFEASAASMIDLTDPLTTLGLTYLSTRNPSLLSASLMATILTP